MEIRKLTDLKQIEHIYSTSMQLDFPGNEIKPLIAIEKALQNGIYECYGLYRDRTMLGYAFFVTSGKNYLLDYFAICQAYRNKGFGSVFLNRLSAILSEADCIICEVDDPEKESSDDVKDLCERRLQFYLSNGFRKTDVTSSVFGASFQILIQSKNLRLSAGKIAEIYSLLYKSVLPEFFFKTCFSVFS